MSDINAPSNRNQTVAPAAQPATSDIVRIKNRALEVEEVADLIWLAAQISQATPADQRRPSTEPSSSSPASSSTATQESMDNRARDDASTDKPASTSPASSSTTQPQETKPTNPLASMHIPSSGGAAGAGHRHPFLAATATALPHPLALARSLRPLKQTAAALLQTELDERVSAETSAETNTPTLVMRPQKRRWLDIALVIDHAPTMTVWHRTIAEFVTLLRQLGAFRDIKTYGFRPTYTIPTHTAPTHTVTAQPAQVSLSEADLMLYPITGAAQESRYPIHPRTLIDPQGERIILVVTDTSSDVWNGDTILEWIDDWSYHCPVTLLHLLPHSMWAETQLAHELDVTLSSSQRGVANDRFQVTQWPWYWDESHLQASGKYAHHDFTNPIPVITLEPHSLGAWANLIAGNPQSRVFGYMFERKPTGEPSSQYSSQHSSQNVEDNHSHEATVAAPDTERPSMHTFLRNLLKPQQRFSSEQAEQLFNYHWRILSSGARKLASYLAAVPITLDIIRIVQYQIMGAEAQQLHIAELMHSGIFCQLTPPDTRQNPDEILYDFYGNTEVRQRWRETALRTGLIDVFHEIADYVSANAGKGRGFQAFLAGDVVEGEHELGELGEVFAEISVGVLQALGWNYSELSKKIEARILAYTLAQEPNEYEGDNEFDKLSFIDGLDNSEHKKWKIFDWTNAENRYRQQIISYYQRVPVIGHGEMLLDDIFTDVYILDRPL
ncbi:MAG: SAV_2336 N-terminal domain-related protein, partial [Chloroflexota bacterium]